MSLKSEIIKNDIVSNNKDWKLFSDHILRIYIQNKYKAVGDHLKNPKLNDTTLDISKTMD
jgi:hypothetical protein